MNENHAETGEVEGIENIHPGAEVELEIIDLAYGGKGVAKIGGCACFVEGTLPGQKVRARISKRKKRHVEAKPVKILRKSPLEVDSPWQQTPGAPWIRLPPEVQRDLKKKQVWRLFRDFAGLDLDECFDEFIFSPLSHGYRNKMDYSFGITENCGGEFRKELFGLGSKKKGSFYLVDSLEKPSGIFDEELERILPEIRNYCADTGFTPYGYRKNKGFFRYLSVRKSFHENSLMLSLITTSEEAGRFKANKFFDFAKEKLGERLASFEWLVYDHCSDAFLNKAESKFRKGERSLTEKINGLHFKIFRNSFFQTNSLCCEKLYAKVVELCEKESPESALDLYCGMGTITQSLAKAFPGIQAVGVESASEAVDAARIATDLNGIDNLLYVCGDVGKFLKSQTAGLENELVVLDPPRSGMVPKALAKLIELAPRASLYVSCNPSTMARDAKLFLDAGYRLKSFSLVDQFPHTHHVECVGMFRKEP